MNTKDKMRNQKYLFFRPVRVRGTKMLFVFVFDRFNTQKVRLCSKSFRESWRGFQIYINGVRFIFLIGWNQVNVTDDRAKIINYQRSN